MKKVKIYEYKNCSTCKKAIGYLEKKGTPLEKLPIVETPPTLSELKLMLKYQNGEIKKLFNTSGQLYRELNISKKMSNTPENILLDLLSKNGKLIKRPFVLGSGFGLVGFKEEDWKKHF